MRGLVIVAAALGLAGCSVTSPGGVGTLMSAGMLRVTPHPTDAHLAIVQLSSHDLSAALDDAATRRRIVETMLGRQCGTPTIEDARVTQAGTAALGNTHRLYTLTVRCPNGATSPAER